MTKSSHNQTIMTSADTIKPDSQTSNPSVDMGLLLAWTFYAAIAVLPFALCSALLFKFLALKVLPVRALKDFRVGNLALSGETKGGEFVFTFIFFGIVVGVLILVFRLCSSKQLTPDGRRFIAVEAILSLPSIVPIVLGGGTPLLELIDSTLLFSLLLQIPPAFFMIIRYRFNYLSDKDIPSESDTALRLWFLAASPIALMGLLVSLRYFLAPEFLSANFWIGLGAVLTLVLVVWVAQTESSFHIQSLTIANWGFAVLGIFSLPLLLPPLLNSAGTSVSVPGIKHDPWILFFIISSFFIIGESLIRRFNKSRRHWMTTFPSLSIVALLIPLRGNYGLPSISADDYHFGETLSPKFLWSNFNQTPYSQLNLPRGFLANIVPGLANSFFFNGTAATLSYVYLTIGFMVVGISHVLIRKALGLANATIMIALTAVAFSYVEGDLFVVALLIFVFSLILRRSNPLFVGVCIVSSACLAVLAYPLMGAVMSVVILSVLIVGVLGHWRNRKPHDQNLIHLFIPIFLMSLLVFFSPLGKILISAIRYVAKNAVSNSESNGIALNHSLRIPLYVGQLLSMTFVLGIFVTLWILWVKREIFRHPNWTSYASLMISMTPALFAIGLFGRFLGRIDPSPWFFRAAVGSIVVMGLITPAVLLLWNLPRFNQIAKVSFVLSAVISIAIFPMGRGGLLRSTVGMVSAPLNWTSEAGIQNIPALGYGMANADHITSLIEIKSVASNLPDGEPVLNLSNRGSLFAYMNWSNPISYLAPYNIPTSAEEIAVIKKLKINLPKVAFISPGVVHDGGSLTLRNPLLTNWLIANYKPIQCGSTMWAVLTSTINSYSKRLLNCPISADGQVLSDTQLWASSIGAPQYLTKIPLYWGARAEQGSKNLSNISIYESSMSDGLQSFVLVIRKSLDYNVTPLLLELSVSCNEQAQNIQRQGVLVAKLEWNSFGINDAHNTSSFDWETGKMIIPLDAYPSWQPKLASPNFVRLHVPTTACTTGWQIKAKMISR